MRAWVEIEKLPHGAYEVKVALHVRAWVEITQYSYACE